MSSPWLKTNLNSIVLKCIRIKEFKDFFNKNYFTIVEKNFDFECSEMYGNKGLDFFNKNYFTIVEKNFEFECSEMCENKGFSRLFQQNLFTMVEENFEFQCSKMHENEGFSRHFRKMFVMCHCPKIFIPPQNRAKIFRTPTKRA